MISESSTTNKRKKPKRGLKADYKGATPKQVGLAMLKYRKKMPKAGK